MENTKELRVFTPDDPRHRFKLWVRFTDDQKTFLHVYWKRVVLSLLALMIVGWELGTAAVWANLCYRQGFEAARYETFLFPWEWDQARLELARSRLDKGEAAWKDGKYKSAVANLRAGLAQLPDDLPRRQLLGTAYIAFGRVDYALDTLEAGAEQALRENKPDYLRLLFVLLFEVQDDSRALALAKKLLPQKPDEDLTHLFIALNAATALQNGGAYDQAEQIIADWGLHRSAEGQLLLAQADWERGHRELAVRRLVAERANFPKRDDILVRLIRYHRELGDAAAAREAARARFTLDVNSPGPRLDLLYTLHDNADFAAVRAEADAYLTAFEADATALQQLAWFALDVGDVALATRVHDRAIAKGHSPEMFVLTSVQARLAAQDYAGALAAADMKLADGEGRIRDFGSFLAGLRSVAYYGLGDPQKGELQLSAFLNRTQLRATDGLFLARQLVLVGAEQAAARALAHAISHDPYNQLALSELVLVSARLRDREALRKQLPRLLAMRKPSRGVLEEAAAALDLAADQALLQSVTGALAKLP